ncbi:MAG: glycosyltransferase family 39 protein [Lacisediminihabitans sp.]
MTSIPNSPSPAEPARTRSAYWPAIILGLGAALLSLLGSWVPSLWGDEVTSILSAQRPLPSLFSMLGHVDAVHGTYYLLLHFWIDLFGASPFSVRLPSAIAVGLAVSGVVILGKRLAGYRAGVIAGVVCMILPRVTYMGEEARSFALSAACAVWLTILLVRLVSRAEIRPTRWLLYSVLLAVSGYVFLFSLLILASHAIVILSLRPSRRLLRSWLSATLFGVLLAFPVIFFGIAERKQISYLAHRDAANFGVITVDQWFGNPAFAIAAWAVILFAVLAAALAWLRSRRTATASDNAILRQVGPNSPSLFVVAATWLFAPTVLLLGANAVSAMYTVRYLSFSAPAAALLIGLALSIPSRRWAAPLAIAALVVTAAPTYLAQRTLYAKNSSDWASVAEVIKAHARPGDGVLFDESLQPSKRLRLAMHGYPDAFQGLNDIALKVPYTESLWWSDSTYPLDHVTGRLATVQRVWLIEYRAPGKPAGTYDLATLYTLGFTITNQYPLHRSVVLELNRN